MKSISALTLFGISLGLGGCAGLFDSFSSLFEQQSAASVEVTSSGGYGMATQVLDIAAVVRAGGEASVISSRALVLPSNPLSAITVFDYQYPPACGGHRFRLYEAEGTEILEYAFAAEERAYLIRDYIKGPSPFVQAGLWTAYDHTEGNVADMSMKFERRGDGLLAGTYSQGPITGLDTLQQEELGNAYARALKDTHRCGE